MALRVVHSFVVPGNPVGYYAAGRTPNRRRQGQYIAYQKLVQSYAMTAGARLPLRATAERPMLVHVVPYFASGVHCDPENVRKGIADALFYAGRGAEKGSADKHTGGSFPWPLYDRERPRVEVTVEVEDPA